MDSKQRSDLMWRVYNWARWASGGGAGGANGRCGSAEGRYIREALNDEVRDRLAKGDLDVQDAQVVEQALCARDERGNMLIYPRYQQFIVMFYAHRRAAGYIVRELGIDSHMLDGFRESSLRRLREVLVLFDIGQINQKRNKRSSNERRRVVASMPTTSRVSITEH